MAALGYTLSTRTILLGHLVMTLPLFLLMLKTALDRLDPPSTRCPPISARGRSRS